MREPKQRQQPDNADWTAGLPEISLLAHERRGNPPQVDALAAFLRRELPNVMNEIGRS
ncbi:hypothetical protein [Primorskyibacter sedentarius]|uniref:hypothetical protein n=1 Tax=Primorskyibacter sedentarius TaxID=745311 RepID=UPI0014047A96|nr:hypothetical protein [Primorskyibacter sedentarius]